MLIHVRMCVVGNCITYTVRQWPPKGTVSLGCSSNAVILQLVYESQSCSGYETANEPDLEVVVNGPTTDVVSTGMAASETQ